MIQFLKRNKTVLLHTTVWLLFIILTIIQIYNGRGKFSALFIINTAINICLFYINFLILIPQLLIKKKIGLYFGAILALLVFSSSIFHLLIHYFPPDLIEDSRGFGPPGPRPLFIGMPILVNIPFLIIGTAIRMYIEWNRNENNKREIEKLSTTSQLHFLKNQINPHFFFNSLNTIYSLASKKSNDAPEAVITLSELMRYMLYRTNKDFVPLQEEFDYINNYIKLQRLRLAQNENVSINIFGTITDQKISPLLLISFIENAFKYGTDYKGNTEIKIMITVEQNHLHFHCVNLIGSYSQKEKNSGIGLKNVQERLNLLYSGKFELNVSDSDGKYIIDLNLKLN